METDLFQSRIFVSILLGIGAGVLGLENLWGVIFYLVGSAVGLALFLIINTGLGKQDIFFTKWKEIFTVSMSTNLFVRALSHHQGIITLIFVAKLTFRLALSAHFRLS